MNMNVVTMKSMGHTGMHSDQRAIATLFAYLRKNFNKRPPVGEALYHHQDVMIRNCLWAMQQRFVDRYQRAWDMGDAA